MVGPNLKQHFKGVSIGVLAPNTVIGLFSHVQMEIIDAIAGMCVTHMYQTHVVPYMISTSLLMIVQTTLLIKIFRIPHQYNTMELGQLSL